MPAAATAPALIAVGFLMCTAITRIDFERTDTALPAFLTLLMVPLTYSIAHGIGYGFLSYVGIAVCSGRARAVHPIMYGVAARLCALLLVGVAPRTHAANAPDPPSPSTSAFRPSADRRSFTRSIPRQVEPT